MINICWREDLKRCLTTRIMNPTYYQHWSVESAAIEAPCNGVLLFFCKAGQTLHVPTSLTVDLTPHNGVYQLLGLSGLSWLCA